MVSPFGTGAAAFWEGLLAGRTAVAPIRGFPAADLAPGVAAEVRGPCDGDDDRTGGLAVCAAELALADARLDPSALDGRRLGVVLGTTSGALGTFERWDAAVAAGEPPPGGLRAVPYWAPGARIAQLVGARGPVATPQLACASGTHAVALAADWVATGRADVVLAGGADTLTRFLVAGFNSLRATADVARPFDRDRRGLVLGEGAAVLVIESVEHAARRGADARAVVLGAGAAADAVHMTAPDRDGAGAARAIRAALADAGLAPEAVDFVSAHGTGTPYNDAMEAAALGTVFAPRSVAVNGIKGAIGHTLGAAGALEAVLCVEVLARGVVPPTVGLEDIDPACAALDLVCGAPRPQPACVALSTSSGFAGANAAIVLGRP